MSLYPSFAGQQHSQSTASFAYVSDDDAGFGIDSGDEVDAWAENVNDHDDIENLTRY